MAAASAGSSSALASTQGLLKLCTFNIGCKEDTTFTKQWDKFKDDLLNSMSRVREHANMVCLQEVSPKVWNVLMAETPWVGHWHADQKFALMWDPEVTVCVCVCVFVCVFVYVCVCICMCGTLAATQGNIFLEKKNVMREVWKIDLNAGFTSMRVCPGSEGKNKKWRQQMLVTWEQGSILYAIGCTHTIDGKGDRKLTTPLKSRIGCIIIHVFVLANKKCLKKFLFFVFGK